MDGFNFSIGRLSWFFCQKVTLALVFLIAFSWPGISAADASAEQVLSSPVYECSDASYRDFLKKHYVLFEVGQVHPLEASADGRWLYALNSPLGCLEIYRVHENTLELASSVVVGLQPVTVRARNDHELWVVNNLSDSVSIVELAGRPRVVRILQVGDEPSDVVFAAPDVQGRPARAYLSCAARGQHHPAFEMHQLLSNIIEYQDSDGRNTFEKLGMGDVWVYDITSEARLAGIINPFMSSVRSLAVSEDGNTVFAAGFLSGNKTASIAGEPGNPAVANGVASIATARIVQEKAPGQWVDAGGNNVSSDVNFTLPDIDVIEIDATRTPKPTINVSGRKIPRTNRDLIRKSYSGAGSVLFAMDVDQGRLLLTSLESHNAIPLEENLRGKTVSNQLVQVQGGKMSVLGLDDLSLGGTTASLPLPGAIHAGRQFIYVAAFGSDKTGLFTRSADGAGLVPAGQLNLGDPAGFDPLQGMGPAGVIELASGSVVILSRMDNALHLISPDRSDKTRFVRLQYLRMFTPESDEVVQGRRFLYGADHAGNGKTACGSCHVFGDSDGLAWDLGSAKGQVIRNMQPFLTVPNTLFGNMAHTFRKLPLQLDPARYQIGDHVPVGEYKLPLCFKGSANELHALLEKKAFGAEACLVYVTDGVSMPVPPDFHVDILTNGHQWASINMPYFNPLKGPMGTQTLFGLADGGPMHHRGDRTGREPAPDNYCPSGITLAERAFKEFNQDCHSGNSSFVTLLGGPRLRDKDMDAFTAFALQMHYPPNPNRRLDNHVPDKWLNLYSNILIPKDIASPRASANENGVPVTTCNHCHRLDPENGYFGSSNSLYYSAPQPVSQDLDVPDFRAFHRQLGRYAVDYRDIFYNAPDSPYRADNAQLTGFGMFHNAAFDPVHALFNPLFFRFPMDRAEGDVRTFDLENRKSLFYFLSSFDTDVFPVAGQQRMGQMMESERKLLLDPRFCQVYGFAGGQFFEGSSAAQQPDITLTCYPVLHHRRL